MKILYENSILFTKHVKDIYLQILERTWKWKRKKKKKSNRKFQSQFRDI